MSSLAGREADTPSMETAKGPSAVKADKNPKGGLSAKGRTKFGVSAGVKNYASASRKDKGRWVSWAMRFTSSPKPVKDDKGKPTRYALMFRAWGEPVPATTAAVKAVHAKAVKRSQELKNSDSASVLDELVECIDCSLEMDHERAFVDLASLWTHVETVHLDYVKTTTTTEEASMSTSTNGRHVCVDDNCDRDFLTEQAMYEHAEAVHTFSDIEELVRDAVRDKYNREGNYRVDPVVPSVYAWCRDFSTDWVVFEMNRADKGTLYKSSYSITDGTVTLGAPIEVVRKTVYEPVPDSTKQPSTALPAATSGV